MLIHRLSAGFCPDMGAEHTCAATHVVCAFAEPLLMWLCAPGLPVCSPVQARGKFSAFGKLCSSNSKLSLPTFRGILQAISSIVLCNVVSSQEGHSRE